MPTYYIMDLDKGMAETVAPEMPSAAEIAGCKWLPDKELAVYATEWDRTGFQGGLQWYRCTTGKYTAELETLSGRTIDVPVGANSVPHKCSPMQSEVSQQHVSSWSPPTTAHLYGSGIGLA